ncbi:MAG TPA: NADH-quinone oxidoreductase subunit N [Candidatus Angelobacter sp.]|nr:NADH-quinone oxidoreductase subunit N [Candidatus Angelobacter sp.]
MNIPILNSIMQYLQGDGATILPEIELTLFGLGILLIDFTIGVKEKYWNAGLALAGTLFSGYTLWKLRAAVDARGELQGFQNSVVVDHFFLFFGALFLAATALVVLLSVKYLEIEDEQEGEYYALLLFACVGMMFMASGSDLIVLFLGLETMALSFYVLTGFLRRDKRSNEAALKYVLLGAFSSGILAYGFSLLYGLSASTNIVSIGAMLERRIRFVQSPQAAAAHLDPFLFQLLPILAFVLIAVGLFFKVAAVPFHQWAPDVYEGAPTPVTIYVSVASKTASFALLLRLFLFVFWGSQDTWLYLIAGIAVASLTWGNLAALTQTNVKRLLAYSSISHVGYVLLGLVAGNETALTGIGYYLLAYVFMTAGAFAVLVVLRQKGLIGEELEELNGLYQRSPAAAVLLLVFMLSLAGIPPTAGFMGKYFIFLSLIETRHPVLAVFAVLYIVPALYYYFRIVVHAWLKQPGEAPRPVMTNAQAVALGIAVFVTLAAGLYPEPFTKLAHYAFTFGQ